jgi:hypothetical protein
MTKDDRRCALGIVLTVALALASVTFAGCERKEKVLDVKTPNSSVEVERSKDTGKVDVNVESHKPSKTEAETPNAKVDVDQSKGNGTQDVEVHTEK